MESSIQIEEAAAVWLARRDGGTWSEADEAEFSQWLRASTANRVAFVRLDAAWQRANRLKALGAGVGSGAVPRAGQWRHSPPFERLHPPAALSLHSLCAIDERDAPAKPESEASSGALRKARRIRFLSLAATVLIAATIGIGWYLWPDGPSYRTPIGGLAAVPMSDGSRIILNTNSEVRVAVTQTERRVELSRGEAFFEVAKDPARPFVVKAGDKRIIAIGTKFSVRRDERRSGEVLVVVTEGRVRVESGATRLAGAVVPPAEVSAGRIARSGDAGVLIQEKPLAETEEILSWRSGYLIFRDITLADAVAEFNRYNTNKIVIEDAAVAGIRIGGNFRSTNVTAFVRLLEDGFPIRVEQRDERIILTRI